jgi:nitric oxide reductase NorD protein
MSIDDYKDLVSDLPEAAQEALREHWSEIRRAYSPRGIDNYLKGALALHHLGRGEELVTAYVRSMPDLAKSIGEDLLPEVVSFLLGMSSKASGAMLTLIVSSAPKAAVRLSDEDLFRRYLNILSMVLTQAPRGLRPMLENLEQLLSQLTLGGLRRWVMWGAQAYKNDLEGQARYFSLQSSDAQQVLQKERKGTLFVDVQRRLTMYLRAIWARDFFIRPTAGDYESREGTRPYIERYVIYVPDAYDDLLVDNPSVSREGLTTGLALYRAALNHAAAHLVFTQSPLTGHALSPVERAVIEVVEDARVEELACRQFPNLREAWLAFHPVRSAAEVVSVGDLLRQLSRALLEQNSGEGHPWVLEAAKNFRAEQDLTTNQVSLRLGMELARSLVLLDLPAFSPRQDMMMSPYRDDNRTIWESEAYDPAEALRATWEARQPGVRKKVGLMEMVNETNNEFASDNADEVWVLPTEFMLDQEGVSINSLEGRESVTDPVVYNEWDYQIQLERPAWVSVQEYLPPLGDLSDIEAIIDANKPLISRLRALIASMVPQGVQRVRRIEDGDEIDLNAAVQAMIDLRLGQQPDHRIMMRNQRSHRDLAVMVLLDLSESSNDNVRGQEYTIIELSRAATVMLSDALDRIGDPFAIHGFSSNGRHDVRYSRFKDFDDPYDDKVKARLAGMHGSYSTRMGAALRHAGAELRLQPQRRKVIFIVTDGEPADNDERDPLYLRMDTKHAVDELAREGITVYALSLDPYADQYVSRIFGVKNFTVLDHVERLPEKLPLLYMGLTR